MSIETEKPKGIIFGNGNPIKPDVPGVVDPDCVFNLDTRIYEPRKNCDGRGGNAKLPILKQAI